MRIPLEYASFQIESGELERAMETLEQGRALLWSEMRGLRTSVDQLRPVDSILADKFLTISKALEAVTTSVSLHEDTETGLDSAQVHDGVDAFSRTLRVQQKLRQEREAVIANPSIARLRNIFEGSSIPNPPKRGLGWTNRYHQPLPMALRYCRCSPRRTSLPHPHTGPGLLPTCSCPSY
jgi:hypothetical protein